MIDVLKYCHTIPPIHPIHPIIIVCFLPILSEIQPVMKAETKRPMVLAALRICWSVARMTRVPLTSVPKRSRKGTTAISLPTVLSS